MFRSAQQIGPYTLIKRIGRGGFGEVWLAERRAKFVTTKVAIKLPLEEQVETDAIRNEAGLWEQASGHPNVLPIIDADEYDGQIVNRQRIRTCRHAQRLPSPPRRTSSQKSC